MTSHYRANGVIEGVKLETWLKSMRTGPSFYPMRIQRRIADRPEILTLVVSL